MNNRPKVLIVGAGPTGLVMAHELARDGIDCRVVDKSPHRAMQSRAIAIHSRTMETLELMGLADDFLDAGHRIAGVNVYGESGRIAHAEFGKLDTHYPFVLGEPQDETERILEEHVARQGVRVERSTELVAVAPHDTGVAARLRTGDRVEEVEADWLLGCDGAHSTVREQLAISFSGATYPEHFELADIRVDGGLDHDEAQVSLHRKGRIGVFPASGGSLATRRHQLAHRLAGRTQPRAMPGPGRRAWPRPSPARRSTLVGGVPHSPAGGSAFSRGPGVSAWRCSAHP
jgi:2-polyprenyl-6-methoxyphenol hydroxylase-like FAD-dependent oxidoreductase